MNGWPLLLDIDLYRIVLLSFTTFFFVSFVALLCGYTRQPSSQVRDTLEEATSKLSRIPQTTEPAQALRTFDRCAQALIHAASLARRDMRFLAQGPGIATWNRLQDMQVEFDRLIVTFICHATESAAAAQSEPGAQLWRERLRHAEQQMKLVDDAMSRLILRISYYQQVNSLFVGIAALFVASIAAVVALQTRNG